MGSKEVQIAGYTIKQINETEYEVVNQQQNLDFHFDTANPAAVEVFVRNIDVTTKGGTGSYITTFYAEDLSSAVQQSMALTRRALDRNNQLYKVVMPLREIARQLEIASSVNVKAVIFPGWHMEHAEEQEIMIKEAATAILAKGIKPDEGTHVSQKAIAALLRYIADMME